MKEPYSVYDINTLAKDAQVANYKNLVILHDNFDNPIRWDETRTYKNFNSPIKLSSVQIILFCWEGEITLQSNMQVFNLSKGNVIITKSGLLSTVLGFSKDVMFSFVGIGEEFYIPINSSFNSSALQKDLLFSPMCFLSDDPFDECLSLYKMLKTRLQHKTSDVFLEEIIKGYLQTLTFLVYSQFEKPKPSSITIDTSSKRNHEIFNQFMELLQNNYTKERNIQFYADKLCLSSRYLSRIIHEISGHYASEHIDLFVIAEAKELLRSKQFTILQISEMLNFSSQSFFGRYFKKFTGYTPRQYQLL